MRKLTVADYLVMPWKNGGGTTTQLAVSPAGARLDSFDWRISTAQVASDGPFSAFPGIDRSLAILRGHGLHLTGDECLRMDEDSAPFVFRGEQPISATLKNGPVIDFNVMTRRTVCTHLLEVIEVWDIHRCTPRSDLMLLYVARGQVACLGSRREKCIEGESLLVDWREETAVELAVTDPARICLAHITFKETQDD